MINMTNVEYIDYFEKIIANEPENILSLYFVQKLMSDVRFRSFQPMISAELQKKILKMVLPKLKNQFKINRLVDFNPIGVADEEIEILNKESVTDVGTFVKTLDDGKVCKEIENLQIDKVSFYCLRVVYEGKCVYLLRQFSKMKKLRSGLLTHFINDELVEMESDFLGLDEDVDMVLCEDSLVILNHISLERIFNYRDQPICFVNYAKLQWKDWFENSYRMLAERTLSRLTREAKSEVTPTKSKRYPENWISGKTVFINRATVADDKVDVAGRVEKYIANIGFNTVHKASRNNLGRRAREKIIWGSLSAGQSFRHERLLAA